MLFAVPERPFFLFFSPIRGILPQNGKTFMKIELHAHTSEVSPCGKLTARELIQLYRAAGYDCIVITNHFSEYAAKRLTEKTARTDFADYYHEEFEKAAELGRQAGLLVLCGYEVRFRVNANDYLVYGMPREIVEDHERIFSMDAHSFGELARKRDFLFYQAHPFRSKMTVTDPADLFGIEVHNAHPRHDSRNDIAKAWAEKFHLHGIGGSDCHRTEDAGRAGILTEETVRNMDDLVRVLRNDLYTIF